MNSKMDLDWTQWDQQSKNGVQYDHGGSNFDSYKCSEFIRNFGEGIRGAFDKLVRNFGEDFAGPDKLSGVESQTRDNIFVQNYMLGYLKISVLANIIQQINFIQSAYK